MESEGEGGFLRGSRDGRDRAQKWLIRRGGMKTKGNDSFSTRKVLSEPNVKVVFHQTAAPSTLLSTRIIYPKGPLSAIPHAA